MNDVKLQEGHPVDENLRPIKVGGKSTALETAQHGNGARVNGDLDITGDIAINGTIRGGVEYGWFRLGDSGTANSSENNFGLGSTVSTLYSSKISWDDTNDVISVNRLGIYDVVCNAVVGINSSYNATIKIYINTEADTLGTEMHSITFELDATDDPMPVTIRWMGKVNNGEYIACTIDAGSRSPYFDEGSTLSIKSLTGE